MPYINLNGQLTQVTQEQYDIYTVGQNQTQVGTTQTPAEAAAAVAAGGTVTQSASTTATILTPNTVNNTPGQTLTTTGVTTLGQDFTITETVDALGSVGPQPTVTTDPAGYTPAQLNEIAAAQGVAGEEGNITTDTLARDPGSFTAAELDAIAEAQGVAGEEGNITTDTLARDPGSFTAAELDAIAEAQGVAAGDGLIEPTNTGTDTSADSANALAGIQGQVRNAQQQQSIASQRKQVNDGDWRVRLRLAPQAKYLYNAPNPGILAPLSTASGTDGIIFPYTPTISTAYRAKYNEYDLTHSNYRGYFYSNSYVDAINLTATFTAQDTNDANYLLAVIHFFRSVTKMFYGQDAQRGTPPPLVYLSGYGDYQFREHACLITQFQYNLPADVDYIRAGSPNNNGLNQLNLRDRQSVATNTIFNSINRLAAAFLPKGGITKSPAPPTIGQNRPTYVPTKMEIQLTLLPVQSRKQVSQTFSLEKFANGDQLKGGFW